MLQVLQRGHFYSSNSQYAKAGNAIGETAIGVKKIEAANHVTEESSGSGSSPLTESEMGH